MSDIGPIVDALGDAPAQGAIAYARGAWMWGQSSAGESFSSTVAAMQGTPLGMRRDQLLSLWQDMLTTQSEAVSAGAIGFDQLASGALAEQAPENWTGQYTYRVDITTRTRGAEGEYYLESTPKWFISGNVLSPEEVVNTAMDLIELPAGVGTPDAISPSDVVMANLSGAWYRTRPGVLGGI